MLLWLLWLGACGPSAPVEAPDEGWTADELRHLERMRLDLASLPPSPTNAHADDPRAARLGQALFYDAGLSPSGTVSCATCHVPGLHFTDGKRLAEGVGTAGRHTPGIVGSQWGEFFFWDGRADSLWSQALGPIESPVEMGGDRLHAIRHVATTYTEAYTEIFGPLPSLEGLPEHARPAPEDPEGAAHVAWTSLPPERQQELNRAFAHIGKALEAFERELLPSEAPFDRYVDAVLAGDPDGGGALDEAQVRGLRLFLGDAGCVQCHHGPTLSDRAFHNLGLPESAGYDPGRTRGAMLVKASEFSCSGPYSDAESCPELEYLNPTFQDFRAAFKTPTLRGVTRTAPYMHHGAFATLEEVLAFYSTLPGDPPAGHRELTLKPLELSAQEMADLKAFLAALDGGLVDPALQGPPPEGS